MFQAFSRRGLAAGLFSLTLASATPAAAINLFSVEQDAQVGRQAAQDAERQLPMLRDGTTESYVNAIVQRLAGVAPGPRFEYRAHVVNTSDINAFALPGGYVYVNRGLIGVRATRRAGRRPGPRDGARRPAPRHSQASRPTARRSESGCWARCWAAATTGSA
jgi:Zn-dependent protease with chaperone function